MTVYHRENLHLFTTSAVLLCLRKLHFVHGSLFEYSIGSNNGVLSKLLFEVYKMLTTAAGILLRLASE